jgi:hypothetical protein
MECCKSETSLENREAVVPLVVSFGENAVGEMYETLIMECWLFVCIYSLLVPEWCDGLYPYLIFESSSIIGRCLVTEYSNFKHRGPSH